MQILFITSSKQFLYKSLNTIPQEDYDLLCSNLKVVTSVDVIRHDQVWKGQSLKFFIHRHLDSRIDKQPYYKGVIANVDKIDDDDYCFVADMDSIDMTGAISLAVMSIEFKNGKVPQAMAYDFKLDFQRNIEKYTSTVFTDIGYDYYVGEKDVAKRVCRYCGLTNTTPYQGNNKRFVQRQTSHALSWFLGNKHTWCCDECNKCNNGFGSSIEKDFNQYFAILRVLYHHKSRNGYYLDDYEGQNFSIKERKLSFRAGLDTYGHPTEFQQQDGTIEIKLIDSQPTVRANMYRCLVKYLIDCLPLEQLPFFQRTIEWVNGKIKGESLPRIFHNDQLSEVYDKPWLKVFLRKDDDRSLPYCVGELMFFENIMFFAVPYCQTKDTDNDMLDIAMENFIRAFHSEILLKDEKFDDEEKTYTCQHLLVDAKTLDLLKQGWQVTLPAMRFSHQKFSASEML